MIGKAYEKWWQEINFDSRLKPIKWLWNTFSFVFIITFFFLSYILLFEIPSFTQLENPQINQSTTIYDASGKAFGSFYVENRVAIDYKDLNPLFEKTILAVEDERFYEHSGIDFRALSRVLYKTIIKGEKDSGGGSTVTQQLAKLLFQRPNTKGKNAFFKTASLVKSKFKEWIIAIKLERKYTKEEILSMYLNKFEFINGAHGVQSASKIYFGKDQKQLDINQVATLVGMLKNPSLYNPVRFPEKVENRRNEVLEKLEARYKYKLDSIKTKNIDLSKFQRHIQTEGPAPHFRVELTKWVQNLIEERNLRKVDGSQYNVFTDGLKIYTTIDLRMQKYAEEASFEHMKWLQGYYTKHWKGKDPWTTNIKDDAEARYRQANLIKKAKESDRYKQMKRNYIGKDLAKLPVELNLNDEQLENWINKKPTNVSIDQKTLMDIFEKNEAFQTLKENYFKLEKAFKEQFSIKQKLKVFDYAGEKEIEMTPMDSVKYMSSFLQNAMIAIDPSSGYIKAWVGGVDHKYFKYDHVTSRRAVGSVMKPFVFMTAMLKKGIKPCDTYFDVPYTINPGEGGFNLSEPWTPNNATEKFTTNPYNLYHGLVYSKNSITVRLLKELGNVDMLRDMLDKVGIDKDEKLANGRLSVPKVPAICLGAVDISLKQMTGAYTTFANNGVYTEPYFVTTIKDKDGKVLYTAQSLSNQAIDPLHNAVMVDMLKNVVGGDFSMNLKSQNGGKTGTTDDFVDGWFMGITPTMVAGVWTGGDDRWIRFTNLDMGQGFVTARPAYERFFKKLEADKTGVYKVNATFPKPPKGFNELTNCPHIKTIPPEIERQMRLGIYKKKDSTKIIKIM
jgi:penicillin-binding protein 1A